MGHTSKPLRILVADPDNEIRLSPEIQALEEQGHEVYYLRTSYNDLILGPRCWRVLPETLKYIDFAVKEARQHRYGGQTSPNSTMKAQEDANVNPDV